MGWEEKEEKEMFAKENPLHIEFIWGLQLWVLCCVDNNLKGLPFQCANTLYKWQ